jgi:hypothetical protein
MKHFKQTGITILLFISLSFSINTMAQQYQPIPDSNAVWDIVFFRDPAFPDLPPYHSHFKYSIKGDTILDNFLYSKIFRTLINVQCSNDTSVSLYGFVRNDVINKKVYYHSIDNNAEELLYDFDLQIGDTLQGSVFLNDYWTVGVIDSIPVHDVFHKRYEILLNSYFLGYYLIEGIGTSLGLFERVVEFWPIHDLRCFTLNDNLVYTSQYATECGLETDTCFVDVEEVAKTVARVYPNPANSYVIFELHTKIPVGTITITDFTGRPVTSFPMTGEKTVWQMAGVKPGVYLFRLKTLEGFTSGKLLIAP